MWNMPFISPSFSLCSGTSWKLAAKSDRIVKACPILCVSEQHHSTLRVNKNFNQSMTSAVPFGEYQRIPVHALIWHCLIIRLQSEVELEDGSGGSDIWLALGATPIFFIFLYICKWMIRMLPSTIWENLKCCLKLCPHTRIPYRLYNYSPVYICLSNLIYHHFLHLIRWTALSINSECKSDMTWMHCHSSWP